LLIQLLAQTIEEKYGSKESRSIVLLAPTGIAAFNINGMTIHRFFKLPIHLKGRLAYKPMSNTDKKELRTLLLKVRLIIIDEFSMVSNIMLGMIYLRLSECFGDKKHFGGKNILLFGDLLQLEPVKADYIFRQINQHDSKTVFGNMGFIDLWSLYNYSELTQNMRQKDDLVYAEMLGRIRLGSPSENDIKLLEQRLIKLESQKSDTDAWKKLAKYFNDNILKHHPTAICLMSKNEAVSKFNMSMLRIQVSAIEEISAIDSGNTKSAKTKISRCKRNNKSIDISCTAGLEEILLIGVNSRVILRRNLNVELGLVNGAIGTVTGFVRIGMAITSVAVKFDELPESHMIDRVSADFEIMPGIIITRRQFPLSLSYALTIHKCQGLTVEAALVDVGESIFEKSMSYVALSRVKSLSKLFLIALDRRKLACQGHVVEEYNRLRRTIQLPTFDTYNSCNLSFTSVKQKLKQLDISVMKSLISAEKDSIVERSNFNAHQTPVHLRLTNYDKVSCYANSIVQNLLRLPKFIDLVCSQANENRICQILASYALTTNFYNQMSTLELRNCVSNEYRNGQHDWSEFFLHLLTKIDNEEIKSLFAFNTVNCLHCLTCRSKRREAENIEMFLSPSNINETAMCGDGVKFNELVT